MEFFKLMKKRDVRSQSRKKKGYNQVAYVRRGTDYMESDGDGGFVGKKKIPTVWVTTKSGDKYEIPVDAKTGKVPEEFLFARFLAIGQGTRKPGHLRNVRIDLKKDADMMHEPPEGGYTPQQLIETGWWQYPNESDVEGIDDRGALSLAKELEKAAKSAQGGGNKMVFLMPESSADRAREYLAKNFTAAELNTSVRNGGIIIKEGNPGRGASGCYVSRQEGLSLKTPVIILGKGWNEETLTHEFTHHLRHVDVTRGGLLRTPMRINADGDRVSSLKYSEREFNSSRNLEEAATVAESVARIQDASDGPNGYYAATTAYGKDAFERYRHARKVPTPVGPTKRKRAQRTVAQKFDDTSISHLGYYRPGKNAANYYADRKAAGTLPIAQKPAKRRKSDPTGGTHGPVGAEATAKNKNRKIIRSRK